MKESIRNTRFKHSIATKGNSSSALKLQTLGTTQGQQLQPLSVAIISEILDGFPLYSFYTQK